MSAGPIEPAPHGAAASDASGAASGEAGAGTTSTATARALPALPPEVCREIDHWIAKFPPGRERSAVISALRIVQEHNQGYLTVELMDAVAAYLKLPPIQAYEVASFYSMFETRPCGRHHVSVCTNISCFLRGAEQVAAYVEKKLGIRMGQSTPDGRIFLKREEECLAACTGAPMMMVDHIYHEHLTPEKIDQVLDALE